MNLIQRLSAVLIISLERDFVRNQKENVLDFMEEFSEKETEDGSGKQKETQTKKLTSQISIIKRNSVKYKFLQVKPTGTKPAVKTNYIY
jgi:hypothetical protein